MKKTTLILFALIIPGLTCAQTLERKLKDWAAAYERTDAYLRPATLSSCDVDTEEKTVRVVFGGGFPEQTFSEALVEKVYKEIKAMLPDKQRGYDLTIEADGRPIEELVPNFFRSGKKDSHRQLHATYKGRPWVTNISRPYTAPKGLDGNHISLWPSHGRYYKTEKKDWLWQRPRLFCTTEDLLSQSIVIPYIIPMLQNAGAVVFTPRERDYQTNEIIVDNDHPNKGGVYIETTRHKSRSIKWKTTEKDGFAWVKDIYEPCDSPFTDGSARYIPSASSAKEEGTAQWIPDIPQEGRYAVYVSYQSYANSVPDASYTVYHKGGMTEFKVNQQMGGGTWVYLGTFSFDKGEHDYGMVTLSNRSEHKGVVTADAVRFGGGMGNIRPASFSGDTQTSGLPRWAEGAKYSCQWYGFPYSIHTEPFGSNDYNNDINSRSAAINYLSGGSVYNPSRTDGLRVPLDLNIAFHTDAGHSKTGGTFGTLGIYMTDFNEGLTAAGEDRYASRDLASMLLSNLHSDLSKYRWQVRQLWNRNYGEARAPMSVACILEMLSHQNFQDMRLAYDPQFKFDFARSVYKTIVKFEATQHKRDYVIQPLPVENFHITLNEKKRTATLRWSPTEDPLEPSAKPKSYIVYTRRGYEDFDNGTVVKGSSYTAELSAGTTYSFRITALNDGGESFPSEVLACGIAANSRSTVLIVNGFTRLEGPKTIDTPTQAGFDIEADPGVPYGAFTGYCGPQRSYDRSKAGSEASDGLGASAAGWEGKLMMGNTFDYPYIHGNAIMLMGNHSFTSCSIQSLAGGSVNISDYPILDLIYGTQKEFSPTASRIIEQYFQRGGKVLMSGSFNKAYPSSDSFAGAPRIGGTITSHISSKDMTMVSGCGLNTHIYRTPNPLSYSVPQPSVLSPTGKGFPILTYSDGSYAAIAEPQRYVILGFPLETITERTKLNSLTQAFITFLDN